MTGNTLPPTRSGSVRLAVDLFVSTLQSWRLLSRHVTNRPRSPLDALRSGWSEEQLATISARDVLDHLHAWSTFSATNARVLANSFIEKA